MSEEAGCVAAELDPVTGTVAFGQYRILELIGAGGMAEVYRASSVGPGGFVKPVVIKRVKPKHARDPGFIRMFVDEAKLSAKLQHPNIVSVFEFGEIEGHHYIAMEYIDGLHLQAAHVCHMQLRQQPLPWQACMLIARDVLLGLDYAHEKTDEHGQPLSLVHRDINLVNIMIGRSGAVKILDFGIVKAAGGVRSAETMGGVLKGKFGYMSPEQAEGKPLDRRSDVFSASIVLHELLTGRRLFWGEDDLTILRRVCAGEVVDPRVYRSDLPENLVTVTLKGLARNRDDRWSTAQDMAEALEVIVAEHRVGEGMLRSLMEELMPPQPSEASETMRQRRRRVTLMAWAGGVKETQAPDRAVSGELGIKDLQVTTAGKRKTAVGPAAQADEGEETFIVSEPRWLAPENVPDGEEIPLVLGEQDTTVVTGASLEDGSREGETVILPDIPAEGPTDSGASNERQSLCFPAEGALQGAETMLLDRGELKEAGLPQTGEPVMSVARAAPSSAGVAVDEAPVDAPRRRLGRLALATLLLAAVAVLVVWLVLHR